MAEPETPGGEAASDPRDHARRVADRVPHLVDETTTQIMAADPSWAQSHVSRADLRAMVDRMLQGDLAVLNTRHLQQDEVSPTTVTELDKVSQEIGARTARRGVPLVSIMEAERLGLRMLWAFVAEVVAEARLGPERVIDVASDIFDMQVRRSNTLKEGWSTEAATLAVERETRRSALVEALLVGEPLPTLTLWEVADVLRLPPVGRYVVVVAAAPDAEGGALGRVEQQLRAARFASAWRLHPTTLTGIVALAEHGSVEALLEVLRSIATRPVGVSPVYDQLSGTADALRLARISLLAARDDRPGGQVIAFDRHPLAVTAVASLDVNDRIAHDVLGALDPLPAEQRDALLDTLQAWIDADGSTARAADALYLHRNTVGQRLNRLQQLTGRSLTSPRATAELCIALATVRREFRRTDEASWRPRG